MQREFAELIFGKPSSAELGAFVDMMRNQVMTGTCPPAVLVTLLHYLKGKPTEHVEVVVDATHTRRFAGTPRQQLEARAAALLTQIRRMDDPAVDDPAVDDPDAYAVVGPGDGPPATFDPDAADDPDTFDGMLLSVSDVLTAPSTANVESQGISSTDSTYSGASQEEKDVP